MKKGLMFASLALALVSALALYGCGAASQSGSSLTISGRITGLAGQAGVLTVIASTTTEGIPTDPNKIEVDYNVAATDTAVNYTITVPSAGTYYVLAAHLIGTGSRDPAAGDKAGQYANGYVPAEFGQTPSAVPDPIVVGSSAVTGKDFELKITWGGGSSSLSISGTVTLPGVAGLLWVGATTDEAFGEHPGYKEVFHQVTATDTAYNYTLTIDTPGTYYVLAVVYAGTTEATGYPKAGDKIGEYADGYVPAGFLGQTPTGTPTAIPISSGTSATGKDFQLKVTWI